MNPRRLSGGKRWIALGLLVAIPLVITAMATSVIGGAADRTDQVPALIVNNDQMVTTTAADGSQSPILAGRLLVTALTGDDSPGFSWSLANTDSAAQRLKAGTAYAVVTIPEDFSKSIASLSGSDPVQANITMTTDEAHSYLAGSLAQALGTAMTSTLGQGITEQYLSGLFSQLGSFGSSMSAAAGGASQLSSGAAQLHDGLVTLSTGLSSAASGANLTATGVRDYTSGVTQYTQGVDSLAGGLALLSGGAQSMGMVLSGCANSTALASCPAAAYLTVGDVQGVLNGVQQSASGAEQIAAGSPRLRSGGESLSSGVSSLASGLDKLADGSAQSAVGAGSLADGANTLANGLQQGADQLSAAQADPAQTAKVVSQPITITRDTLNPVGSLRDLVALLILPAALWLGALAIFVARRPFSTTELQSTSGSLRIVARSLGRAMVFGLIQVAVALIAALVVGVSASAMLWAALLALTAVFAFVSIHLLFKLWWPRAASLISMVLLVTQILAMPGVLPSQMLPEWMQAVSPLLPLTWATNGMQSIVAGTGYATAIGASVGLLLFGVVLALITTLVLSRRRISSAWGFAVAPAT